MNYLGFPDSSVIRTYEKDLRAHSLLNSNKHTFFLS
nr:MAG TPA: hypothetical protein [Caudoviricetes sp.]